MAFILALFSLFIGYTVSGAFSEAGWKFYATLSLVDLCLLYMVSTVNIIDLKRRYMSCILAITIFVSSLSSLVLYIYEYYDISTFDYLQVKIDSGYTLFSMIMSVLLVLISITRKRTLNAIDNRFWPDSFSNIYGFAIASSVEDIKKDIQK